MLRSERIDEEQQTKSDVLECVYSCVRKLNGNARRVQR
jgi:hypothetical protein